VTLNTVVLAAWAVLVGRYSGRDEVVFGLALAGRPPELAGMESMAGLTINAVPVRVELPPDAPLLPWLADLHARQLELQRHGYAPLALLRRWCGMPKGTPLFELFVSFQSLPLHAVAAGHEGTLRLRQARAVSGSSQPLTLLVEPGDELILTLSYDSRRFAADTVERLLRHLGNLLRGMAEDPERTLASLPMLSAEEAGLEGTSLDVEALSDGEVDALLDALLQGGTDCCGQAPRALSKESHRRSGAPSWPSCCAPGRRPAPTASSRSTGASSTTRGAHPRRWRWPARTSA
jgi:non-ribosomal peptide synthetase component F